MRSPWGPFTRRQRVGVPSDHFRKASERFAGFDRRGRMTALVAEGQAPPAMGEGGTATLAPPLANDPPPWAADAEALLEQGSVSVAELREVLELPQEVPDSDIEHVMADHSSTTVTHSHEHGAMGSQGDDETHSHEHSHESDSNHDHHSGTAAVVSSPVTMADLPARMAELRERQAKNTARRMTVKLVDFGGLEVELPVEWDERRSEFVSTIVAAGADMPQLVENPGAAWHAILCVEGLRTDEDPGREITPGACKFPDLPVSLRLQIEDEGGHWGAVTCGRIDAMERIDMEGYNAIAGSGVFGTDEHGQLAQLLVEEQTQRFISIDPRDVDMEIVEVQIATSGIYDIYDECCEPDIYDWWIRYTNCTIGAATIVATPALQQAVITLASVELPTTPIAVAAAQETVIVADGGPLEPPSEWFENPGFHVGDPRLVRQPDGKFACPLEVTEDGHVFGHVCYWGQKHTASQDLTPPRSKAELAHYLTGPGVKCAGGLVVHGIGQITMGCGHAPTSLRYAAAKAHYDGGYGAVQVADVRSGQDDFGVWISGALRSDLTPEQLRQFRATGLSGDWRRISGNMELIAVLAGVPVQGFPIVRGDALVASGADEGATRAGLDPEHPEGEIISLVASGRVHRVPTEERLAQLERLVGVLAAEHAEVVRGREHAAAERLRELVSL